MRKLPAALAISTLLHGAAIAYVALRGAPDVQIPQETPRVSVETPRVMDVEILPLPADPSVPAAHDVNDQRDRVVASQGVAPRAAVESSTHAASRPDKPEPQVPAHRPTQHLTMRGPDLLSRLVEGAIDLPPGKPLPPSPIEHERIADDIHDAESKLHDPSWVAHATPDEVTAQRERLVAAYGAREETELQPAGGGKSKSDHETFDGRVAADGTAHTSDTPDVGDWHVARWNGIPLPLVTARMSFDDALMRKAGIDPYAAEKLKWLDKTRDERVAIGKRYRKAQLGKSGQLMRENVAWLWQKTQDLAERKRALFELWDDVAEPDEARDDDPALADGAKAARDYLVGFVRAKLPAGSAGAYTSEELAQLNAHRHSRAPFAPYAD